MATLLVIEDGTGVATANSYVDADAARQYARLRGVALPAIGTGDDPVEIMLIKAADYLNSRRFVGIRATGAQALEWPRVLTYPIRNYKFICLPSFEFWISGVLSVDPSYYIVPQEVKNAQMQLCIEQQNGIDLVPSTPGGIDGQFITRLKVDVIETSYSERINPLSQPRIPLVDSILRELLLPRGIRAVRV